MKRENDSNIKQHDKQDFDFLDDRMQLLDTVRKMIDVEFERHGVNSKDNHHLETNEIPGNSREPPDNKPPCQTLWQQLRRLLHKCIRKKNTYISSTFKSK